MKQTININESQLRKIISESIVRVLSEAQGLKSKKLYDIFSKYGRRYIAPHYDSSEGMDLHNVTDDDVVGVFKSSELPKSAGEERRWVANMGFNIGKFDGCNNVELGKTAEDGELLYAVLINRNAYYDVYSDSQEGGFKDYVGKKDERRGNHYSDGAKHYRWKSKDAQDLAFNNPYYKGWDKDSKERLRNKIAADYQK